jgi:hypothetical protein
MDKEGITYKVLDWEEMGQLCFKLAKEIISSGKKFDRLITFAKGGWTLSRALADYLSIDQVASIQIVSYKGINESAKPIIHQSLPVNIAGEKILLFDDVNDTGETLQTGMRYLDICGAKEITSAIMYHKSWSEVKPDFIGATTKSWVIFPHEIREMIGLLKNKWDDELSQQEIQEKLIKIGMPAEQVNYFLPKV